MPLRAQSAADQMLKRSSGLLRPQLLTDGTYHPTRLGNHCRSQTVNFCNCRDTRRIQQVTAAHAQHLLTLLSGRHRQFNDHVKTAHKSRVHAAHCVREPYRRHRVVLQHAVDPGLAHLRRALAAKHQVAIVEDILSLIKHHQRRALRKKTLRGPKGTQAVLSVDGVAVFIFAGHLKQLTAKLLRQCTRQFALACTRRPMQKDVHATQACLHRVLQIRLQNVQRRLNVRVISQTERALR